MNKDMKGMRELTAAVKTMWKYDRMDTEEAMEEIDAAYHAIEKNIGKEAAEQAYTAWRYAAKASCKARATEKAMKWLETVFETMTDEEWAEIEDAGADYCFIEEGLGTALWDLKKKFPDSLRYQEHAETTAMAAFVYGFKLGKESVKV